jgi:hypothetical protein
MFVKPQIEKGFKLCLKLNLTRRHNMCPVNVFNTARLFEGQNMVGSMIQKLVQSMINSITPLSTQAVFIFTHPFFNSKIMMKN